MKGRSRRILKSRNERKKWENYENYKWKEEVGELWKLEMKVGKLWKIGKEGELWKLKMKGRNGRIINPLNEREKWKNYEN